MFQAPICILAGILASAGASVLAQVAPVPVNHPDLPTGLSAGNLLGTIAALVGTGFNYWMMTRGKVTETLHAAEINNLKVNFAAETNSLKVGFESRIRELEGRVKGVEDDHRDCQEQRRRDQEKCQEMVEFWKKQAEARSERRTRPRSDPPTGTITPQEGT